MDTAVKPQGCTNIKLRQLTRRVARYYEAEVGKTGLKNTCLLYTSPSPRD